MQDSMALVVREVACADIFEVPVMPMSRLSTSVIPEECGLAFALPTDQTTRHTLTCIESYRDRAGEDDTDVDNEPVLPPCSARNNNALMEGCIAPPVRSWRGIEDWHDDGGEITPRGILASAPYEGISVEIKNHSINNQGVVMYHVDIGGRDGILSMYTIRRRFRAFRNLYFEMDRMMTEYAAQMLLGEDDTCMSECDMGVPCTPHTKSFVRQRHETWNVSLPPLPSAGIWSYLKRHDIHLVENRKKCFQELLRIVMQHPATRCSAVLGTFLSVAPNQISQRGTSYVSLMDYSVPILDRKRESMERKQRKIRVLEHRHRANSNPLSAGGRSAAAR